MRPIKFRAWDADGKQMHFFGLFDTDEGLIVSEGVHVDEFPIMQFTGLLDKNGKEIYEGDVVRIEYFTHGFSKQSEKTQPVVWGVYGDGEYVSNIECWMADDEPVSDHGGLWGSAPHTYEIIGNIYENPELLKEAV